MLLVATRLLLDRIVFLRNIPFASGPEGSLVE